MFVTIAHYWTKRVKLRNYDASEQRYEKKSLQKSQWYVKNEQIKSFQIFQKHCEN